MFIFYGESGCASDIISIWILDLILLNANDN